MTCYRWVQRFTPLLATAARRFFHRAIGQTRVVPAEMTTDQAPVSPAVLKELLPATWHHTDQCANHRIECTTAG